MDSIIINFLCIFCSQIWCCRRNRQPVYGRRGILHWAHLPQALHS